MKENEQTRISTKEELPETSRLEQLKMLLDESLFKTIAFLDYWYGRLAHLASNLFDKLPIADQKRAPLKSLAKKLVTIFGVIFLIFFVFVWLNPILGFLATIGLACAVFYWPDLAFRYREYVEHKKAGTKPRRF